MSKCQIVGSIPANIIAERVAAPAPAPAPVRNSPRMSLGEFLLLNGGMMLTNAGLVPVWQPPQARKLTRAERRAVKGI